MPWPLYTFIQKFNFIHRSNFSELNGIDHLVPKVKQRFKCLWDVNLLWIALTLSELFSIFFLSPYS